MKNEIIARSILTKSRLPESDYCINPYVGCTHACAYCYARFMRRFTGHANDIWGKFVDVKVNTGDCLKKQLKSNNVHGSVLIGSVCDAYQPVEKKYMLTRDVVRQLIDKKISFSILTKSDLVLRDMDLLHKGREHCSVGISLSMLDDKIRKIFEPLASPVANRLNALKRLHDVGIHTYLFIGPILPEITDLHAIADVASIDADEIWGEALNLKCGNHADLVKAYTDAGLSGIWENHARDPEYWRTVEIKLEEICRNTGKKLVGFFRH